MSFFEFIDNLFSLNKKSSIELNNKMSGHSYYLSKNYLYVFSNQSIERAKYNLNGELFPFELTNLKYQGKRYGCYLAITNNHLFSIGGENTFSIEKSGLNNGIPEIFKNVPDNHIFFIAGYHQNNGIVLENNIFLIGGETIEDDAYFSLRDIQWSNFDNNGNLSKFSILEENKLVEPRQKHTITRIGNYIYAIGGLAHNYNSSSITLNSIERAKIKNKNELDKFELITQKLTKGRMGHTATIIGNYLYIIGGTNYRHIFNADDPDTKDKEINYIERAKILENGSLENFKIVSNVKLNINRQKHTSVQIGKYLYVLGGETIDYSRLKTIERSHIYSDGNISNFDLNWK